MDGLSPGEHGLAIHECGDISGGCSTVGDHFNPRNVRHGSPLDNENTRHGGKYVKYGFLFGWVRAEIFSGPGQNELKNMARGKMGQFFLLDTEKTSQKYYGSSEHGL